MSAPIYDAVYRDMHEWAQAIRGREAVPLTPHSRCDRCGATAQVEVMIGGMDLLFCKHHYEAHEAVLTDVGVVLVDQRASLEGT